MLCPRARFQPGSLATRRNAGYGRSLSTQRSGEPARIDFSLHTDPETLVDLLDTPDAFDDAVAEGRATVSGDRSALHRILRATS